MIKETPQGRKKIIPVNSDFETSPSPESPTSPVESPFSTAKKPNTARRSTTELSSSVINTSHAKVPKSQSSARMFDDVTNEMEKDKKSKSIGLKLKNSYSELI